MVERSLFYGCLGFYWGAPDLIDSAIFSTLFWGICLMSSAHRMENQIKQEQIFLSQIKSNEYHFSPHFTKHNSIM